MVVDGARSAGARLAQPGEFTARAFLGGAMDLFQAEAVAATIAARSDRQLRAARKLQEGDLSRRITEWRARLMEVTALIEADIDFADEPIEFITPGALRSQLSGLAQQIEALRAGADAAERFDVLPTALLIGRPNAGKSSLMNALSGLDRAICSAVSGTTRDIVSAPIKLGTTEAMLLDAAGVHEDADALMREAQARVLSAAEHVDLLCLVIDVAAPPDMSAFDCLRSTPTTPCVLVANKIDLLDEETRDHRQTILTQAAPANVMSVCAVSATEGTGLDHLRDALAGQLGHRDDLAEEKSVVLSARQRGCLASASQALDRAIAEAEQIGETVDRAEVLALELREALDALGELIGAVTTEDLLSTIFASFCIGK
ncbi:MAG: GTP-binding protein [Phycisphaerales bacterium]|nr:MAG: GTP-binding protein [Phycisphaerales bacterium]